MLNVVFIIAQNNFRDEELLEPKRILERRGVGVKIASATRNVAVGARGSEIRPDLALPEIKPSQFDGVIFVGGSGATQYFYDLEAYAVARGFYAARKLVAAICLASSILGNAGILLGKRVTGFPSEEGNLINRGAEYTGMPVEVDEMIVTGKDPAAAVEFGERLAEVLEA